MCVAGKGCRHICTVSASRWCLLSYVQEYNVAFSPRISVITAETACNCQRFSKIIRRDKLWITVIIKLDWCHWTATAGRCFHRLFADTVSVSACLSGSFSSLGEQERPVGCFGGRLTTASARPPSQGWWQLETTWRANTDGKRSVSER